VNINHHPDETTLISYAAGTLDEAFAVIVSCHLQICETCREDVKTAELIGGSHLEQSEEAPLSQGSFGRLLEKISVEPNTDITTEQSTTDLLNKTSQPNHNHEWSKLPLALRNYLETNIEDLKWKRLAPGVSHHPIKLSENANSSLRLLRIAKGKQMPEHGHNGHELTLILQGAYQDKFGTFAKGDIADLDDDVEHQPKVISDEDCICLAATEAPTKFKSLLGRILQPIVGI
jgi:putative transcriptional regulator